jgi:hypothetical protein
VKEQKEDPEEPSGAFRSLEHQLAPSIFAGGFLQLLKSEFLLMTFGWRPDDRLHILQELELSGIP